MGLTLKVNHEAMRPQDLEFLSMGFAVKDGIAFMRPLKLKKFRAGLLYRDDGNPATRLSRVCAYKTLLFGAYYAEPDSEAGLLYIDLTREEQRLMDRYDSLLANDSEWIQAKCQRSDEFDLLRLHMSYEGAGTPALKEQ